MRMTTQWDNEEKTILRVTYHPEWTWDDLEGNLPLEEKYLDSVDHRVDVIADFRGTRLPLGAISRLPKIAQSPPYTHRNSGKVVMVGSPAFMKEVVGIYKRVYGQASRLTMVTNLEEARALLAEARAASDRAPESEAPAAAPTGATTVAIGTATTADTGSPAASATAASSDEDSSDQESTSSAAKEG
jgi:hypothetical protein